VTNIIIISGLSNESPESLFGSSG